MTQPSIRVLIADDHLIVREGLRTLLARIPDIALVGEAADGDDAVAQAVATVPDVILLDLRMPRVGGVEAIKAIKAHGLAARILVLTSYDDDDSVFSAIRAGAQGYLLKDSHPDELVRAVRDVFNGASALHPAIARRVLQEINRPPSGPLAEQPLTERELEVLQLVAQGLSNNEIARRLVIGERTVATHVRNILGKLHLASRTQAALYAIRAGLSDPRAG